jgi:homoaconitase/3-isopropylmalate dehydratase large subunit
MAIEAGGKNGIFPVDDKTREYIKDRFKREPAVYEADPDAEYERVVKIDLSKLEPTVSMPHLPSNTKTVGEAAGLHIDQVVIGSCTNGRLTDLKDAAKILEGNTIDDSIRLLILPASREIYRQAIELGYINTFIDAGAIICNPGCGPCLGGHMGVLSEGESCISTTNRNFKGRMGDPASEVYLSNSKVVAASAITGTITNPKDL